MYMRYALVALLATKSYAFFPTDFREAWFGGGGISHETQTTNAFNQLAEKYFPDIREITKTMIKARSAIVDANIAVDKDQETAARHFDGEAFDAGQTILVDRKAEVIAALKAGDGSKARAKLGDALHGVQDFYAHSNWVELGKTDINYDLGKKGVSLTHAGPTDRTCNDCNFGGLERIFFGCRDCEQNTAGFNLLTSGYYFGEDTPKPPATIPDYKCHHGMRDSRPY